MTALPPPEVTSNAELAAWNALARAWAKEQGTDPAQWPEKKRRFVASLKQQLAVLDQGEAFFKVANIVIGLLEGTNLDVCPKCGAPAVRLRR